MTSIPRHEVIWTETELGRGAFGAVLKGKWQGLDVALKVLIGMQGLGNEDEQRTKLEKEFQDEVFVLRKLRHLNIVSFYGITHKDKAPAMVVEYCHKGSLRAYLQSDVEIPWAKRWEWAKGISAGLAFIHANRITHCDLKSPNILLSDNLIPKICDFGAVLNDVRSQTVRLKRLRGSLLWIAPELMGMGENKRFTAAVDVYALGIVLWELTSRVLPWKEIKDSIKIIDKVLAGDRPQFSDDTPIAFRKLIAPCWIGNRKKRCTASQAHQLAVALHNNPTLSDNAIQQLLSPGQEDVERGLVYVGEKNFKAAEQAFHAAVKKRNVEGHYQLAILLRQQQLQKDEEIVKLLTFASEQNHAKSAYELSVIYFEKHDYPKARKSLKKAADLGYVKAAEQYGVALLKGSYGVEPDQTEALKYLKQAADGGAVGSMFQCGQLLYRRNQGDDRQNAITYLEQAEKSGHLAAAHYLGCLFDERGDTDRALIYFRKVAKARMGKLFP